MAISFPNPATLNQIYTVGSKTWKYNGYAWDLQTANTDPIFSTANTALTVGQSAFAQANTALTVGQSAFAAANNEPIAKSAFAQANTALTVGQSAFSQANTATTNAATALGVGQSAFAQANTATTNAATALSVGQSAFAQANTATTNAATALTVGQSAFAQANTATTNAATALSVGQSAFSQANTATTNAATALGVGQSAFAAANTKLSSSGGTLSGSLSISQDLTVSGNVTVQGTTTTLNSTTIKINDKNVELANVASPTNVTADGGGITVIGATNKTFNWINATTAWTSSENLDLASGKAYSINGTSVLNATTLGSGVTSSSLTSVGTITSGTWSGSFGAVSGANLTSLTAGNLSGTIPSAVLGNSTLYVGTTAIALNRASASLALTGITSIDGTAALATTHVVTDSRAIATTPQTINAGVVFDFKQNTTEGLSDGGTYFGEMTFRQYGYTTDWTGGLSHQLGFTDNGNIWQRSGSSTTWGSWKKLLDSTNYSSYASPLAGSSSLTTTGTVTSGTWSGLFGAVSGANLTNLTAGNLSGTIPSSVLGNSSLYVGTTAIALNRASASQSLTGVSIDGGAGYLTGGDSNFYGILYAANSGDLNTYNSPGLYSSEYTGSTNNPTGSIGNNGHWIQISDASGTDVKTQWYFHNGGSDISMRLMWGNANWKSWRKLLHDGNYSTYLASPTPIGSTTPNTGAFTTLSASSTVTLSGGTANGVAYLNASKQVTSGSALTFDGTTFSAPKTVISLTSGSSDSGSTNNALYLNVGTPSTTANLIRFAGAVTSDIYYGRVVNADAFGWGVVGGSEWMRLTTTGLGIGTSSPSLKLDVNGSAKFAGNYVSFNDNGYIRTDAANILRFQPGSGGYEFRNSSNSGNLAILDSSGNLGIGTSSPGAKLDVSSNGPIHGIFRNPVASSYTSLRLYNDQNNALRALEIDYFGSTYSGGESAYIGTTGAYPLTFGTNNTERMRIDSSGNVGIGTSSPAYKLDVSGSILSRKSVSSPGSSSIGQYFTGVSNSTTYYSANGTYTNNNATAPDGTTTAATLTLSSSSWDLYTNQSGITPGKIYKVGMWIKLGTATNFCVVVNNTLAWNTIGGKCFTSSDGLTTSEWTHISYTFTGPASGAVNIHFGANSENGIPTQTIGTVYIWNFELTTSDTKWLGSVCDNTYFPGGVWDSSGSVGIGTSSPGFKFDLNGNGAIRAGQFLRFYRPDNATYTDIYRSASATIYNDANGDGHQWQLGGTTALNLNSSGNLGIGTSSPLGKIDVRGTAYFNGTGAAGGASQLIAAFSASSGSNFGQLINTGTTWSFGYGASYSSVGTSVLTWDSSGNVGIGTSSPAYKLDVNGAIAIGGTRFLSKISGANYWWNGTTATYWVDSTGNTVQMALDSSGNVGIGTSSPAYKLQINATTANIRLQETASGNAKRLELSIGSDAIARISANQSAQSMAFETVGVERARISSDGTFRVKGAGTAGSTDAVQFSGSAPANSLLLDSSGNVGIGTSSPSAKLELNAGSNTDIRVNTSASGYLQLGQFTNGAFIGTSSSDATAGLLRFGTGGTEKLRITSGGNVLIGTSTDGGYKLQVNGSFAATTKSFLIDHPTKEGMKLRYGSLEGPENGVYVRGRLKDNNVIELPDYWIGLVDEDSITVNLTAIGKSQELYVEDIKDNCVYVGGENINCFYTVFAERKDVDKLVVEF